MLKLNFSLYGNDIFIFSLIRNEDVLMKNKFSNIFTLIVLFCFSVFAGKDIFHYVSLPLIEGAGIYASVKSLVDENSRTSTKAASITNLSLMGTNGVLGLITVFSSGDTRPKIRKVHRIVGFTVSAAALWLSISSTIDKVDKSARFVSYGYTGLTVIPIITFSF